MDLRWSPGEDTQEGFIREGSAPRSDWGPAPFAFIYYFRQTRYPFRIPFNCFKMHCLLSMNKSQNLTCRANVFLGGRKLLVYVISVAAISSLFWRFNVALTQSKTFAHPKKTPALQATLNSNVFWTFSLAINCICKPFWVFLQTEMTAFPYPFIYFDYWNPYPFHILDTWKR